jgi:hypothetical protein
LGAIYGATTASDGDRFSGSWTNIDYRALTWDQLAATGRVVNGVSLTVESPIAVTFDHEEALAVRSVAGSYGGLSMASLVGSDGKLKAFSPATDVAVLSDSGAITVLFLRSGCATNGTLTPPASGKGVYSVEMKFQGSACLMGNGTTLQGVAWDIHATEGRTGIALVASDAAKNTTFVYYGVK